MLLLHFLHFHSSNIWSSTGRHIIKRGKGTARRVSEARSTEMKYKKIPRIENMKKKCVHETIPEQAELLEKKSAIPVDIVPLLCTPHPRRLAVVTGTVVLYQYSRFHSQ
jgi:hypothetical protein